MSTNEVGYVILKNVKGHFIRKIIFLFVLMSALPVSVFSQALPVSKKDMMNYNGRKLSKKKINFAVTGIQVDEKKTDGTITFTVYFNDVIDAASLSGENILINTQPLKDDVTFLFNKNRNVMQFSVLGNEYQTDETFSIQIKDIESYDGRTLQAFEIDDLKDGVLVKANNKDKHKEKR